jgi:hypothetical protein
VPALLTATVCEAGFPLPMTAEKLKVEADKPIEGLAGGAKVVASTAAVQAELPAALA